MKHVQGLLGYGKRPYKIISMSIELMQLNVRFEFFLFIPPSTMEKIHFVAM